MPVGHPPKKPRPIPAERLCPTCGKRMEFTHSKQARGYVEKRRACPNPDCKRSDRVWLKLEVVRVLEVAKRAKVCEPTQNLEIMCEPTQGKRRARSTAKPKLSKLKVRNPKC